MKKMGFVECGIEENDLEFEGEWIDSILMSLPRDVWLGKES